MLKLSAAALQAISHAFATIFSPVSFARWPPVQLTAELAGRLISRLGVGALRPCRNAPETTDSQKREGDECDAHDFLPLDLDQT
jgi:hypothetical protein